jgi:hypothetical protein
VLVVDTNILVYAADEHSQFHSVCNEWLDRQRWRADAWFVTWPIVYEFLRVLTHPRLARQSWNALSAWEFVTALLAAPGLEVLVPTQRHVDVAGEVIAEFPDLAGNIFHDAHTVILMREHGIRQICTRDRDFNRFPFLEVIDPLRM